MMASGGESCTDSRQNNKKATVLHFKLDDFVKFCQKHQYFSHKIGFSLISSVFILKNEILWSLNKSDRNTSVDTEKNVLEQNATRSANKSDQKIVAMEDNLEWQEVKAMATWRHLAQKETIINTT